MSALRAVVVLAGVSVTCVGFGQAPDYGGLPAGDGQVETFANCTPCHSTMIVMQQRLNRRTWDEVLTWMVEDKGMWVMPPELRKTVLDYLVEHFGADSPR